MIAVVAALPQEAHGLARRYRLQHTHTRPDVYEDPSGNTPFYLVVSGVGPKHARRHTKFLLQTRPPSAIWSVGVAGALSPDLQIADAIVAGAIVNWDCRQCVLVGDALAVDETEAARLRAAVERSGRTAHAGRQLQSDGCLGTPDLKCAAFEATGAIAVEMESWAIADVARQHGVPFASLRFVSDRAAEPLELDPTAFVAADGSVSIPRALRYMARHPGRIPVALRMQRVMAECDRRLVAAFEAMEWDTQK